MKWDAVIVGGGPGGSAAAISLAQAGLRVMLLEAAKFPRKRPGETLHPGVESILRQLGVVESIFQAGFIRHSGIRVKWEGDEEFKAYSTRASETWYGFQACREIFDSILLERARSLGVAIRQPCRAIHLLGTSKGVSGIQTSDEKICAHFVIDAAGSHHWMAHQLKIPVRTSSPSFRLRYGWREITSSSFYAIPLLEAEPWGWTWIAQTGPTQVAWTRLRFPVAPVRRLHPPVPLAKGQLIDRDGGADGSWRSAAICAGPGWFMVGDAAVVIDPASSHGLLRALMSGIQAAHAIHNFLKGNGSSCADHYRTWMSNWYHHDCTFLNELYQRHPAHLHLTKR